MQKIRDLYSRLSDSAKAAISTATVTFLTTAGLGLIGLLSQIQEWLDGGAEAPSLGDLSVFGKLILSGIVSALVGLVNYGFRAVQRHGNPEAGPHYDGK